MVSTEHEAAPTLPGNVPFLMKNFFFFLVRRIFSFLLQWGLIFYKIGKVTWGKDNFFRVIVNHSSWDVKGIASNSNLVLKSACFTGCVHFNIKQRLTPSMSQGMLWARLLLIKEIVLVLLGEGTCFVFYQCNIQPRHWKFSIPNCKIKLNLG